MNRIKILILEDEIIPASYLKKIIEKDSDFEVVDIVPSTKEALESIKKYKPSIVFVDIMLKGSESGAEFALRLHDLYENIIIIFLTAYSDDEMIEYATEAKAFAYLLKPYRENEIRATLSLAKNRLKFSNQESVDKNIHLKNGYVYDIKEEKIFKDNKEVNLTPKELELVELLIKNRDLLLSKEAIIERMNISDSSLRSLIYRLRKVLDKDIIISSKKMGYKIAIED